MAFTEEDYNKIWASNSPLPEYTFSDDDYLEGWNFVGELPPSRTMWDAFKKDTDLKMKDLYGANKEWCERAETASANAENSAELAEDWATKTDGTVDGNEYSAKHYANEANSSATASANSATNSANSATSATNTANALINFLETKETLTAPAVDTTLTISGAAADAKVTGDLIGDINHAIATGEEVTRFDFNWTSGVISASGISASNDYFYSNPMSASEGLKYKFNTGNYVIEVWAFDESSPNTFYRRPNIPANSVDWQPSAGWLGGHEKARFLYYYQDNPSLISAIKTEKQLALYSELSQTNSSMSILANYGGIPNYIDFDWEIGDIDAQGEIQPSQTGYYHSKLLSRTEFENAVYTLTSTAFVYRYNSDGTYLNRGTSIAAGTTIIPSDALGTIATQARIVVSASDYADTQGFYINITLYTEKEACFKIVSVEDPYYFVSAILPMQVSYKFTNITYEYNGNTYTKPFADIATDIIYGYASYDEGKVSDAYYIVKEADSRIQIAIDPVHNKFIVVRNDTTTKYTIICVNLTTGAVSGAIADAYRHIVFDTMMKTQKKIPYDVIQQLDTKEKTLYGLYDDSSFIFAYLSDCHVWGFEKGVETNLTGLAANRYDEHISFDTILNCGDSVLSVDAYPDSNPYVALENSAFKTNRAKTLYVEGNHDRNIISPVMPIKNFVNLMYREIKRDTNVHFGKPDNGAYYYKDFPQHKIRLIVLTLYDIDIDAYNSNEGYKQDQMEWFANTALVVDSDWHVIVACHTTPIQIHDNNPSQNDNVCKGILESFVAGTSVTINSTSVNVNYPSYSVTTHFTQAGNLVGFFSGHVHKDAFATVNGVNYVSINCGYIEAAQISVRQGFTYSAICFDVAIVDKTNRTVTLKRIGYGSDRNWSY